jgi:thiol-disulfide isomerase/thioredoxin
VTVDDQDVALHAAHCPPGGGARRSVFSDTRDGFGGHPPSNDQFAAIEAAGEVRSMSRYPYRVASMGMLLGLALWPAAFAADPPLLDVSQHHGKVVVVDFWASLCVPCRRSIPWLNAMQRKYADDGLVVIGVNVDRERKDADAFLAQTPAHFRIVYDAPGRLPKEYGVMAMPSSYVFGRDGRLVAKHLGFQNRKRDEYEQLLRKQLDVRKP